MRAKLADLKESDPAAYEAEMKKMGKSELDRLLSKADSRRGSLLPGQTRSRAGSIVIGTGSRRGSCSGTGTNRATVAMVTDDPEHKSAMKEQLANAFGGEESHSATNGFASAAAGGGAGASAGVAAAAAAAGVDTATQQKLQKLAQSDPVAYEKEMKKLGAAALANVDPATQERLAKLKESDPAAYEKEIKKLGAAVAAGAPGVAAAGGAGGAGGVVNGGSAGAGGAGGAGGRAAGAAAGAAEAAAIAGVDKATGEKLQKMKESDPAPYEAELKKIGEKAVAGMDKATQERMAKLKASDPAAYERELKKLGSVAAAGGQPAGGKPQVAFANGLNGSVGAGGGDTNGYDDDEEETNQKNLAGSLPAGTKIEAGADGQVTLGGAKLPQGAAVVTNADGSKSIQGHLDVGAKVERNPDGTYSVDGNKLPPSVTVLRNSDGSMSIVSTSGADPLANTKLPKNSVTNADGSTSIAAGSVIQENPDGTVTVDGVPLPPGTAVKQLSDGSAVLFQSPLASTKLPGSAKVNSDGTATINASAVVKENADGTFVVDGVLLPKGTGVKKMPDGSMVTFEKPRLKKIPGKATTPQMKTNTDGSVSLGNVKLPAGTTSGKDGSISLPPGTSVTRSADGTVMVDGKPLPAGIGAKVNPDVLLTRQLDYEVRCVLCGRH